MLKYASPYYPKLAVSFLTIGLVVCASLAIAAAANISIPMVPVPMTMQAFAVILVGMLIGPRRGIAATVLYLAEGAMGLPVFAGASAGIAKLIGSTGGYLIGFIVAAWVAGYLVERVRASASLGLAWALGIAALANIVIYVPGLLWLGLNIGFDKPIIQLGFIPFIPGDLVKCCLAALLFTQIDQKLHSHLASK